MFKHGKSWTSFHIKIKEIVPNISNQIIPLKIKLKINNKDQLIEKIKSAIYEKN